jgi:hypothetical protein
MVLVPFVVAGCGGGGAADEGASPTPTPIATEILERASRRLAETGSAHFTLDVAGDTFVDPGKKIRLLNAEGDLQRPDRVYTSFKVEVQVPAIGAQTITIQLITVGDQSWTTDLVTGKWTPAPPEFAYRPTVLFDNQEGIGPVMGRVQDPRHLADEELRGRPVHHVVAQVDDSVIAPMTYSTMTGSPVTVDLWIDVGTADLLRARLSEPPGEGRVNPATWTFDLSKHDEKVTIEPPV